MPSEEPTSSPSSPTSFLLYESPCIAPINLTSVNYLVPSYVTFDTPRGSLYPVSSPLKYPHDKNGPYHSPSPSLHLSTAPIVVSSTSPLVPCLVPSSFTFDTTILLPSPVSAPPSFPIIAPSKELPDKTGPST